MSDNPQAFPCLDSSGDGLSMRDPGMTLRDWFAGQALAGMLTHENIPWAADHAEVEPSTIAAAAYELADGMLAERERKP